MSDRLSLDFRCRLRKSCITGFSRVPRFAFPLFSRFGSLPDLHAYGVTDSLTFVRLSDRGGRACFTSSPFAASTPTNTHGCMALEDCMRPFRASFGVASRLILCVFPRTHASYGRSAVFRIFPYLILRILHVRFCHVVQCNRGSVAFRGFEPLHLYDDRAKVDTRALRSRILPFGPKLVFHRVVRLSLPTLSQG